MLRLTTTDPQAIWDSTFNEDVYAQPYSEIALYSLSTHINPSQLTIDAQNNGITYSVDGDNYARKVFLEMGTYRSNNTQSLFDDLETKLNRSMMYNSIQIGKEWSVANVGNILNIQCDRGTVSNMDPTDTLNGQVGCVIDTDGPTPTIQREGAPGNVNDAFFWVKSPQCRGAASMRAHLNTEGGTNETMIMGLLQAPPLSTTTSIDVKDILFGIVYNGAGDNNYGVIQYGDVVQTKEVINYDGPGSLDNDTLAIDFVNERIIARVYRSDGSVDALGEFDGEYTHTRAEPYFPVWDFPGDSVWDSLCFSTSPSYNVNNKMRPTRERKGALSALPNMSGQQQPTQNFFAFDDLFVSQFMGWANQRQPPIKPPYQATFITADNITYKGATAFLMRDFNEGYVVELLNMTLPGSFDSQSNQHRNFIDVIPQENDIRERLTYKASRPQFFPLENKHALTLRHIRARLLLEDLTAPSVYGTSILTLLVRSKKNVALQ
jgi:hypothetical protein